MPTANSRSGLKGPLLIPEFLYGHVPTAQLETQPEKPPEFPASKASKENRNHTNISASFFPDPLRSHITKDISLDPSLSPRHVQSLASSSLFPTLFRSTLQTHC
jgi:hypothetical protein